MIVSASTLIRALVATNEQLTAERDALKQQVEQMKGFVQPLSNDWNKPDMDVYDDKYKE